MHSPVARIELNLRRRCRGDSDGGLTRCKTFRADRFEGIGPRFINRQILKICRPVFARAACPTGDFSARRATENHYLNLRFGTGILTAVGVIRVDLHREFIPRRGSRRLLRENQLRRCVANSERIAGCYCQQPIAGFESKCARTVEREIAMNAAMPSTAATVSVPPKLAPEENTPTADGESNRTSYHCLPHFRSHLPM